MAKSCELWRIRTGPISEGERLSACNFPSGINAEVQPSLGISRKLCGPINARLENLLPVSRGLGQFSAEKTFLYHCLLSLQRYFATAFIESFFFLVNIKFWRIARQGSLSLIEGISGSLIQEISLGPFSAQRHFFSAALFYRAFFWCSFYWFSFFQLRMLLISLSVNFELLPHFSAFRLGLHWTQEACKSCFSLALPAACRENKNNRA